MCHPHTRLNESALRISEVDVRRRWEGAFQLYDGVRKFIFGCVDGDEDDNLLSRDVFKALYAEWLSSRPGVTADFISRVRARTIIDVACIDGSGLAREWTRTDRRPREPWQLLEEQCLRRENLDLFYAGGLSSAWSRLFLIGFM